MFVRVGEICPPTSLHNDQPLFASCIARRSMTHKHRLRTPVHTDYTLPARRCASAGTSYGPASVCLCLSVTSRGSIKKNQRINLVFGMEAFFDQSYTAHTHPFNGPFPGLPGSAGTRQVRSIWILLKQETVNGNGISWAICKSASRSRQITMPVPHHSRYPNIL